MDFIVGLRIWESGGRPAGILSAKQGMHDDDTAYHSRPYYLRVLD